MKQFDQFYQNLPDLLKGDLKLGFAPAVQALMARPEDDWVTILDDEMLALIQHPEIDWRSVETYRETFTGTAVHPLNELFLRMSLYEPLPFNPDIAQALSQRLGAEGTSSLFLSAQLTAGCYPSSYIDRHILLARYSGYATLIPGVIDLLVDQYFQGIRGNTAVQQMAPGLLQHPSLTPRFWSLEAEGSAIPFSLTSLLSALSALDPKALRESMRRYVSDLAPALWVKDFMSIQWGPNGQTTENAMRYVLHHMHEASAFEDFLKHALPRQPNGKLDYKDLNQPMLSTLAITLLRFDQLDELHALHQVAASESFYNQLIEECANLPWDILAHVKELPDSHGMKSGFWRHFQDKEHLAKLLRAYSGRDYLPRGTSGVFQHLIGANPDQEFLSRWLETMVSHAKSCVPIQHQRLGGLMRIFKGSPYLPSVFREALGDEKKVLKRIFNQIISQNPFDYHSAIELIKALLEQQVYSREQVYRQIPSLKCLQMLSLDDAEHPHIIHYAGAHLKREMLEQDISP